MSLRKILLLIMQLLVVLLLIPAIFAGLDMYIQEYQDDSYYAKINVVNNGEETYNDLEIRIDQGGWEPLVGMIYSGTGITLTRTIIPGDHVFEIKTKEGYTLNKEISFLTKARTETATAKTASQAVEELDEANKFKDIRERIKETKAEKIREGMKADASFEPEVEEEGNLVLILSAAVIFVIFLIILFYWLRKKSR